MIKQSSFFSNRNIKQYTRDKADKAKFPKNALIELSNACNHFCVFCNNPRMKRKINNLDINVFSNFIEEAASEGLEEVGLYATGEPFLTKDLEKYISICKNFGIKRIYLTTNGSLATLPKIKKAYESGLNSIKFSINASNRESYKLIHGKDDFDKVKNNLIEVFNWKKKEKINLQLLCSFIYTKKTVSEINEYKKIFGPYVEDINLNPAGTQGGRINSIIEKITTENFSGLKKSIEPCEMLWNRLHLTCEGYLTACCIDYDLDLVYADFKNKKVSLAELWNNSLITKLRNKHLKNNLTKTLCQNCLYGTKNKFNKLLDIKYSKNKKNKSSNVELRTELVSQN